MSSITPPAPGRSDAVGKADAVSNRVDNRTAGTEDTALLRRRDEGSAPAQTRSTEGDSVRLSPAARRAAEVEGSLEREPFFNEARVAELRSAIANGEYRVDSQRLAQAITQFELLT